MSKKEADSYFADSASWAQDRAESLRSSRRIAWRVAIGASVIAILEALALIIMTPLKKIEPLTLLVDRQTGYVQALKPLDPQLVSSTPALTQSFLVQYVIAREGFDYNTIQSDYRKVALWSNGPARAGYLASMQSANPDSPIARYPRSTVIDVQVKSVTQLNSTTAMVRFDTRRIEAGGSAATQQPWVSIVRYRFTNDPMSVSDRFINPLGFQVLRYRRSMEALPSTQPIASQVPPIAAQPSEGEGAIQPSHYGYPRYVAPDEARP